MATITIYETQSEGTEIDAAELVGTEKQVAFAESVRRDEIEQMIRGLNAKVGQMLRTTGKPELVKRAGEVAREAILGLASNPSAAWWLDKRGSLFASDYFSAAAKQVVAAAGA